MLHVYSWFIRIRLSLSLSFFFCFLSFIVVFVIVRWAEAHAVYIVHHSKFESIFAACCISTRLSFWSVCALQSKLNMFTLFVYVCRFSLLALHNGAGVSCILLPITATENVISMLLWVMPNFSKRKHRKWLRASKRQTDRYKNTHREREKANEDID